MSAQLEYQPFSTAYDLRDRVHELMSVPTMQMWDSPVALDLSSQLTVVTEFERLQGNDRGSATPESMDRLLQAALGASQAHWSTVHFRAEPAMQAAYAIKRWIEARLKTAQETEEQGQQS